MALEVLKGGKIAFGSNRICFVEFKFDQVFKIRNVLENQISKMLAVSKWNAFY